MSLTIEMFIPMISETIADLSKENYNKIEEDGRLGRINIDDLKRVITEYGCEIIPLPDRAFNLAEIYYIAAGKRLDIYLPLWTKEEGRSDLTLSFSGQRNNNQLKIEFNDLRVL
ncbi:hypothetical protein ACIQ57_21730 [Lysinibacillus xylanilyticus]|uniref:DUF7668 domain-containing protein n=1 Tax=Lysinibacillus xylanilyticus TaxID=582475 RepID=UPI00380EAA61